MINFLHYFLFFMLSFSIYNLCKMFTKILSMTPRFMSNDNSNLLDNVANYTSHLDQYLVDIAIVDVMMPGMSRFELCKVLKEDFEMPVIMLTARDALSDKEQAYLTGTDDYVTKPFEVKELIFRIKAVLKRYNINA